MGVQLKLTSYTGHEMDDEIGVINMNARIYDPFLGRFLSADPVLPDAYDMQQYNRYAYVMNNPLRYTDPTGNVADGCAVSCVVVNVVIGSVFDHLIGLFGSGSDIADICGGGNPNPKVCGGYLENQGADSEVAAAVDNGFFSGLVNEVIGGLIDGLNTPDEVESSDGRDDGMGAASIEANGESHRNRSSLGLGRAVYNPIIILPGSPTQNDQSESCNGFGCNPAQPTVEQLIYEVEQFRQILRRFVVDLCTTSAGCLIILASRTAEDKLRTGPNGEKVPDPEAEGRPHTQLGTRNGRRERHRQGREFDSNGEEIRDIDFTDHGRPETHPYNPHQHIYRPNPTGGTRIRGREPLPLDK